ncbi:aldo/keto reductase [Microbacterium atlanticum]|uniref:aldo/keto reductase n=1 Tax=Microbacterium atlanticum TaxID=2782168 RepID=UPI0018887AD9|nr:aldo/keto reductase [Microbacterium atlanticum]
MTRIGTSDLDILPLVLGGNVFGWTVDPEQSFALLDAFHAGGGTLIDSADSYSHWVPGNVGGESETIIGQWLASRKPVGVAVSTKVSGHPASPGLSAKNVRTGVEASLKRLGVETIDVYYAHYDDPATPLEEAVGVFDDLVREGLIRYPALSNFTGERIRAWVDCARDAGLAQPIAIQPEYNLVHRNEVEADIIPVAEELELSLLPSSGLASGFLTGKYRSQDAEGSDSPRAGDAARYANAQGLRIIDTLEDIGRTHGASIAATALAWVRHQPTVAAPLASASRLDQIDDLLAGARLELTEDELARLDDVSDWTPAVP